MIVPIDAFSSFVKKNGCPKHLILNTSSILSLESEETKGVIAEIFIEINMAWIQVDIISHKY